jgi:hypothetical protein
MTCMVARKLASHSFLEGHTQPEGFYYGNGRVRTWTMFTCLYI